MAEHWIRITKEEIRLILMCLHKGDCDTVEAFLDDLLFQLAPKKREPETEREFFWGKGIIAK